MALEEADTMDMAADTRSKAGPFKFELFIFDHGRTDDPEERYQHFLNKLRTYVHFVQTAQFRKDFPDISPHEVLIRVLHQKPPTESMLAVKFVMPRGDRVNKITVLFQTFDEFKAWAAGQLGSSS